MRVLVLFLLALTQCCFAQNRKDASALIQAVAGAASATRTWRIEGTIDDSRYTPAATFTLFARAPSEVRFQQNGGWTPAIIVCDTVHAWVYSPPLNRYGTLPISRTALCGLIVGDWKSLPTALNSPTLAGSRTVDIGGRKTVCELVRGKSDSRPPSSRDIKRELCIDTSSDLIVWEKDEFSGTTQTYTFTKIDRDFDMAPDMFVLKLPPGSHSTPFDLPMPEWLGSPSMVRDPGVSMPRILSRTTPVYDEASRRTHVEGTVVLYVVIDTNGVPTEIDFYKHLTPGLDASALQAVKQWRFTPATKNNQPVALGTLIQVTFTGR